MKLFLYDVMHDLKTVRPTLHFYDNGVAGRFNYTEFSEWPNIEVFGLGITWL